MGHIIFIEGNPGSGKTTFSNRLKTVLEDQGYTVKHYQEGDLHPIDLAWCAIVDEKTYHDILKRYPQLESDIKRHTKVIDGKYIFAYTRVDYEQAPKAFYDEMATYEIYREKALAPFKTWHHKLWQDFSNNLDERSVYIFECVYLQNHINELILKHNVSHDEQIAYFNELMAPLEKHNPHLFFIEQTDVEAAINHVAEERKSPDPDKFPDWFDRVIDYIGDLPYASELGYTEYDGVMQYFKDRQTLSKKVIESLPITSYVLPLDGDHDVVFNQIKEQTLNTLK